MLDKIKKVLTYIVLPLTVLFAFISYLMSQIGSLKSQVKQKEAEKTIAVTLTKLEEKGKEADRDEANYRDTIAKYLESQRNNKGR